MKSFRLTLSALLLGLFILPAMAQESLQEKYDDMLETTETYEQYKVIPRTRLNAFWQEVADTLNSNARTRANLRSEVNSLQMSTESLAAEKDATQANLDESLELNDTIYFIGIPFSKTGYHIMVWLIIIALAVLGVLSYLMYMRSNRVTTRVKKEYDSLNDEYEEHKTKAREAQVKLKRELQTALNQLNERRS